MSTTTMTSRPDRNFARDLRRRITVKPMTLDALTATLSYPADLIQARLEWWLRLGMARAVLIGTDSNGKAIVAYRAAAGRYRVNETQSNGAMA